MVSHSHSWLAPCPPAILWLIGFAAAGGMAGARATTFDRTAKAFALGLSSGSGSDPAGAFSSRRCRLGATCTPARAWATPAGGPDFGGAAAIGTTPDFTDTVDPDIAGGDSDVVPSAVREREVLEGGWTMEFFREDFFPEREEPTAKLLALLRLRFLITSVFSESGRTTP